MIVMNPLILQSLSGLFSYPEKLPKSHENISEIVGENFNFEGNPDLEDPLTYLQNSYVRLFINALPEIPCPPYGSFYTEGALMGTTTVGIEKIYESYGFEVREIPDHIAVELEFLALLTILYDKSDGIKNDYKVLTEHLKGWAPQFLNLVKENDGTGFYKKVATFTLNYLNDF